MKCGGMAANCTIASVRTYHAPPVPGWITVARVVWRVNAVAVLLQHYAIASQQRDVELNRQRLRCQRAARKRWPSECALSTINSIVCCQAKTVPNILFRAGMNSTLRRSRRRAFAGNRTLTLPLGRADSEVFVAATAVVVLTTRSAGIVAGTKAWP